jgi:hypothetical protein
LLVFIDLTYEVEFCAIAFLDLGFLNVVRMSFAKAPMIVIFDKRRGRSRGPLAARYQPRAYQSCGYTRSKYLAIVGIGDLIWQ